MDNRILGYIDFFFHWLLILAGMWLVGIGIEQFTNLPTISFGIHTGVIVFVLVFLVRRYLPDSKIDIISAKTTKKEPEISDTNPLD